MLTTGQKIRKLRKEHGLTQEQLAEICGVDSFKVVGTWERDVFKPNKKNLLRLAHFFNVRAEDIYDIEYFDK